MVLPRARRVDGVNAVSASALAASPQCFSLQFDASPVLALEDARGGSLGAACL